MPRNCIFSSVGHISFIYRASNIIKTSLRIVNIAENHVLVSYNTKRLLHIFVSISKSKSYNFIGLDK